MADDGSHMVRPEVPEIPGPLKSFWRVIVGSSWWVTKALALAVTFTFGVHYAANYLNYPANVDYYIDKIFVLTAFSLCLAGTIFREISLSRKEKYANIFNRIESINETIKDLNTYLSWKIEEKEEK